jgi:hypothetical protein
MWQWPVKILERVRRSPARNRTLPVSLVIRGTRVGPEALEVIRPTLEVLHASPRSAVTPHANMVRGSLIRAKQSAMFSPRNEARNSGLRAESEGSYNSIGLAFPSLCG